MKKKIIIIVFSLLVSLLLLQGGYGLWEETLVIRGHINVVRPQIEENVSTNELNNAEADMTDPVPEISTASADN